MSDSDMARRWYKADGSYELMATEVEVIERRKAAAVEIETLRAACVAFLGRFDNHLIDAHLVFGDIADQVRAALYHRTVR